MVYELSFLENPTVKDKFTEKKVKFTDVCMAGWQEGGKNCHPAIQTSVKTGFHPFPFKLRMLTNVICSF